MKIFCIIPAYNEEKNIIEVLEKLQKLTFSNQEPVLEKIIVVDDGSQDRTSQLASEIAKKNSQIISLRHLINRGQGAALQTGNQYAIQEKADLVVHFDADNQFIAQEIKDIIKPIIEHEADIVFGSRFLEKKSDIPFVKKNIIMPLARIVNKVFLKINLTDPQSGFRAMNKKALKKIKITNDGMAHCSEILFKSFQNNLEIKEIPITVIYHDYGQKLNGGIKIIKDLLISKILK